MPLVEDEPDLGLRCMVFIEPIAPLVDTLHTQCFHGFACAAPQDQVNRQRRTPAATAKLCVHRTKVVLAAESFVSFIPRCVSTIVRQPLLAFSEPPRGRWP